MRLIDADKGLISKIQLETGCNFITAQKIGDSMPTVEERKLERVKQIVNAWNNDASHSFSDMCKINGIIKKEEWEEDLKM